MVLYGITNGTVQPDEERRFPLGKGWTWNISYIEISGTSKFLHLGGSGVYKIDDSNNLVGYTWKDLTFSRSTASVNGQTAAYVLTSIQKVSQYFNAQGQLIQISDAFNNTINFTYTNDGVYGSVLQSITDAIGNTITITYGPNKVFLTKGNQTVTYYKIIQNGKELLSQVEDAVGRKITYDYAVKDAQFNLVGTTPNTSNPYALLIGVTHPTGSKSIYQYENTAVTRYTGKNAVNQVYRVTSREDQFTRTDGSTEIDNHKDITYPISDMGSSYDTPYSFTVMIKDGLTETTFTNKKVYIDENTPAVFYNMNVVSNSSYNGKTYTNTTDYVYDEVKRWTSPLSTKVTQAETGNSDTRITTTSKSYDDYGNVTSIIDVLGETAKTTYTYDSTSHLLVGMSKPVSSTQTQYTEYVRDAVHGNITTLRVRDGSASGPILRETINENFDSYGNPTQTKVKKDVSGYITVQTEYNASAPYLGAYPTKQTILVTDANGVSTTVNKQYDYNTITGQLKTFIDGRNNSTNYVYDAIGRVTRVIHPDNSYSQIDYYDLQNQMQQTDETGIQSVVKWNPLGLKEDAGINDLGTYKSKIKYHYDSNGRLSWTEDALGNRTTYGYDQWSRQNMITNPDASSSSILYDDIANTKTSTDAEEYSTKDIYDVAGRVTSKEETKKVVDEDTKTTKFITTPLGWFTFDYAGHLLTATDNRKPTKNTTTYSYDTLGLLISVLDAKNDSTSYQYDSLGNLLQVTYPDLKTDLKKYDEISRLIQTTDANGKIEKFFYDQNGNQVGLIDRNLNYFKYTFDNKNLVVKKEITDSSWNPVSEESIGFSYDLAGRRTEMRDGTGATSYSYNKSTGVLNTQTYPDGKTIEYDYDAVGNRFMMNDPFGSNTYYHYDSSNRLDVVAPSSDFLNNSNTSDYYAKYNYFSNSLLKKITQKNGVTSEFIYDGLRIGSLTEKKSDNTVINVFAYTYDNNGNQDTRTEQQGSNPAVTNNFHYDPLNRISTSDQFNESYGYDNRGNRTTMSTSNPVERPDSTLTFDKRDRLTNVTLTSGGNVSYKYNGDGLLWERTENGLTTRYYWDGDQVIAEANVISGVATLKARYIRGQGLISREDNKGKAYYLQNGHGDVVNLMDSTGNTKLNSYQYDIFGNIVSQRENLPQTFKYSGEMQDVTTGLQYLRVRWYDPSIGRFVGEDSYEGQINNPLSENRFIYVENNPLTQIDPTGHWCTSKDGNWSHPGACDDSSNKARETLDSKDDIGRDIIENGKTTGKATEGIIVHSIVETYFKSEFGDLADVEVAVPVPSNPSGWGRADMTLTIGSIREVYELKPITYNPNTKYNELGKEQLRGYVEGFNNSDPDTITVDGTTWNPNGLRLFYPPEYKTKEIALYTYESDPGMIYYKLVDKNEGKTSKVRVLVPVLTDVDVPVMPRVTLPEIPAGMSPAIP